MSGKSFRFSLDPVLRLRQHEAEMARRQLQQAVSARMHAERVVAEAETLLDERIHALISVGPTGTLAMQRLAGYREDAQRKVEAARGRLRELGAAEEEARRRLVERQREEETMEELRDREHSDYVREEMAADAAVLDEQAINGYVRKNGTSR